LSLMIVVIPFRRSKSLPSLMEGTFAQFFEIASLLAYSALYFIILLISLAVCSTIPRFSSRRIVLSFGVSKVPSNVQFLKLYKDSHKQTDNFSDTNKQNINPAAIPRGLFLQNPIN
jgi:hypothetical protein